MIGLVVAVSGDVDLDTCPALADRLRRAADTPAIAELAVDLGAVGYLGAAGISVLLEARRRAVERGVRFRVINLPPTVRFLFTIADVLGVLS